jgi:hypothetical protein
VNLLPSLLRRNIVRLDDRGYFLEFCEAHGRYPIHHLNNLLFPDGWTYSSTDYGGPEWPPPEDPREQRGLRKVYWSRRREIVTAERDSLFHQLEGLKELATKKSVPLQQVGRVKSDGVGHDGRPVSTWTTVRGPVDFGTLEGRLKWLQEDVAECEAKLKELEDGGVADVLLAEAKSRCSL